MNVNLSGALSAAPAICAARAGAAPAAPGLVTTTTSHTLMSTSKDMKFRRLRRSVIAAAEVMQESLQRGGARFRAAMVTLTYAPDRCWEADHISSFTKRIRSWLERRGYPFRNVWVAELTRKGVVHYHMMLWLPRGVTLPKPDKQGWWPYGSTRIEFARKSVAYLAKYASKGMGEADHGFPKGCRTHGRGGLAAAVHILRYRLLPLWVKNQVTPCDRLERQCGGYLSKASGVFYPSHWRMKWHSEAFQAFIFERIDPPPRPYIPAVASPDRGLPVAAVWL